MRTSLITLIAILLCFALFCPDASAEQCPIASAPAAPTFKIMPVLIRSMNQGEMAEEGMFANQVEQALVKYGVFVIPTWMREDAAEPKPPMQETASRPAQAKPGQPQPKQEAEQAEADFIIITSKSDGLRIKAVDVRSGRRIVFTKRDIQPIKIEEAVQEMLNAVANVYEKYEKAQGKTGQRFVDYFFGRMKEAMAAKPGCIFGIRTQNPKDSAITVASEPNMITYQAPKEADRIRNRMEEALLENGLRVLSRPEPPGQWFYEPGDAKPGKADAYGRRADYEEIKGDFLVLTNNEGQVRFIRLPADRTGRAEVVAAFTILDMSLLKFKDAVREAVGALGLSEAK